MAELQLKPVQLNRTITRVLPEQKLVMAAGDTTTLRLPATIFITSTEAITATTLSVQTEGFADKTFTCPLTGDFAVLYLGADIFGNTVRLVNTGAGVCTLVAAQ